MRKKFSRVPEQLMEKIEQIYIKDKTISMSNLAKRFNISLECIRKRLIKRGVKIRSFREMVPLRNKERTKKIIFKNNFDRTFGYLVGVLYGDGYLDEGGIHIFSKDKEFVESFVNAIKNHFGADCNIRKRVQTTKLPNGEKALLIGYRASFYSVKLKPYLEGIFGSFKSKEWKIPVDNVLDFGTNFCCGLIRGLYDSDGHYLLQFAAGNKAGIESLRNLLLRLSFNPNNIQDRPTAYYLSLTAYNERLRFYKEIGFSIKRKQVKLKGWLASNRGNESKRKVTEKILVDILRLKGKLSLSKTARYIIETHGVQLSDTIIWRCWNDDRYLSKEKQKIQRLA